MTANEIIGIEPVGSPAIPRRPDVPEAWPRPVEKTETADFASHRVRPERQDVSKTPAGDAPTHVSGRKESGDSNRTGADTYVRIRYDEDRSTYFIQVFDAASDEIIREIPPDRWARLSGNLTAPKGIFIKETQ